MAHYDQAAALTHQAGSLEAIGLRGPAQYARTQARTQEMAARKLEVGQRLMNFSSTTPTKTGNAGGGYQIPDFGFSPTVNRRIRTTFLYPVGDFNTGFDGLSPHFERAGLDPYLVASRYPEDLGRMVTAYLDQPESIDQLGDRALIETTRLGGATSFRQDIFSDQDPQETD
jgi:hypothetical protein